MSDEIMAACKTRATQDGNYAIAYAILYAVTRQETYSGQTETRRRRVPDITAQHVADGITISEWAQEAKIRSFCLPEVWEKCFRFNSEEYTLEMARHLGQAVKTIPGCLSVGTRKTAGYGKQRVYRLSPNLTSKMTHDIERE